MPKGEALALIAKAENASFQWLITGEGSPFSVFRGRSDAECAEQLDIHLGEEDWRVHVITDGPNHAYVLTLPGQYQIKDRWVDYTIMEVITGPCGNETAQVIYRRTFHFESGPLELYLVNVDIDTMHELVSGTLGTYKIALADHALLRKAKPVTGEVIVTQVSGVEAKRSAEPQERPEPYQGLEAEILAEIHKMDEAEKKTALRVIKALKPAD